MAHWLSDSSWLIYELWKIWRATNCGSFLRKITSTAVFALRFQNLPAWNSSLKIFKHKKEEKLAGLKGKLAGPAQFLVAEGLGPALNAKTATAGTNY